MEQVLLGHFVFPPREKVRAWVIQNKLALAKEVGEQFETKAEFFLSEEGLERECDAVEASLREEAQKKACELGGKVSFRITF